MEEGRKQRKVGKGSGKERRAGGAFSAGAAEAGKSSMA